MEAFELHSISTWCLANGKSLKALNFAEEALSIIRDLGASKKKEADVLGTLVQAYISKGHTGKAVRVATQGLKRFQDAGEARAEAAMQRTLFAAYFANGNSEQAVLTLDKALEACQDAGDKVMEQQLLCDAAEMAMKAGNASQAIETASKAL